MVASTISTAAEQVEPVRTLVARQAAQRAVGHHSAAAPSGRLIQKIIDQCRCCANTPPRIGPATLEATNTDAIMRLVARPLLRGHDIGDDRLRQRDQAAAADALQAARQDQREHAWGPAAQASEPSRNTAMLASSMARRPWMSLSLP